MSSVQPTTPTDATTEAVTPAWQRVLAALSLAVVNVSVVLPLVLALIFLWAVVLLVAGAPSLRAAEATDALAFSASLFIAVVVVSVGGVASLSVQTAQALRKKPSPTLPMSTRRPGRWLARHPWSATGLLLLIPDLSIVPLDLSRKVDVSTVPVGAALLGTGLWLLGTFAYALARGWGLALRLVWKGVRRSSFFAGLVVVASLATTAGGLLLGKSFSKQARALTPEEPRSEIAECHASATECTRRLLESAAQPKPRPPPSHPFTPPSTPTRPPTPPVVVVPPEPPPPFEDCIRYLHEPRTDGRSLRDWGIGYARGMSLPQEMAEDVVHDAMISVCTVRERIGQLEPYFVQSVKYGIYRTRKTSRRWCPLMPDPTAYGPGCVTRSVEDQVMREELILSAGAALCDLDSTERWLIEARLWENLPYDEIARRLSITPENARQRYSRALATLRERFSLRCE